jgi:2,5-dihydroxypyridine 5,6-dioxygenase
MSSPSASTLVPLFTQGLQMSGVKTGEQVAVYTENGARLNYADAFIRAAESLGARAFIVDVPVASGGIKELATLGERGGLAARPAVVEALKSCDLVVDLVMLFFNVEKIAIQKTGTRVLTCVEPVDTIERCFPTAELRAEAIAGRTLLKGASRVRITSEAGTELTYQIGARAAECQYGMADEPGRWDHFAGTFVYTCANEGGAEGTLVIDANDIVTPYINYVREPVRCTVREGRVVEIDGGLEAKQMRDMFARFNDDATELSHIGWGLQPGARWDSLQINPNQVGLDPRCFRGCVLASTGPNVEFGGTNTSECHFDLPMRATSLWVDELEVVRDGVIVHDFGCAA